MEKNGLILMQDHNPDHKWSIFRGCYTSLTDHSTKFVQISIITTIHNENCMVTVWIVEIHQIHAKLKALEFLYHFGLKQHIGDPDVIFGNLSM